MAIPAILQQLGKANPAAAQIKQMMNMVRGAGNPQAMLNQMIMSNPKMQDVMNIVRKHGGDPMTALRKEAEAAGMDPNEILNMLR